MRSLIECPIIIRMNKNITRMHQATISGVSSSGIDGRNMPGCLCPPVSWIRMTDGAERCALRRISARVSSWAASTVSVWGRKIGGALVVGG